MTFHRVAVNTFAGWLAGTLCSLGGALKDSPVEGFKARTFPRSIVVATGEWLPPEILSVARDLPNVIASPSDEQLARADVGITEAFAGVASSGSICVALGTPLTAAASLLMPLHIVLLAAKRIVARPRDLFDGKCLGGEGLQRNLVFITGPSATADMGPLVRGVHGPHRLHILLLE